MDARVLEPKASTKHIKPQGVLLQRDYQHHDNQASQESLGTTIVGNMDRAIDHNLNGKMVRVARQKANLINTNMWNKRGVNLSPLASIQSGGGGGGGAGGDNSIFSYAYVKQDKYHPETRNMRDTQGNFAKETLL